MKITIILHNIKYEEVNHSYYINKFTTDFTFYIYRIFHDSYNYANETIKSYWEYQYYY